MQIILLEKVLNLGNLGDIVKVKDGYARNFLIPTGKAAALPKLPKQNSMPNALNWKSKPLKSWLPPRPKAKS